MQTDGETQGRILLDEGLFVRLTCEKGWDTDVKRADAIGTTPTTVYRLRKGVNSPSAELIYELPKLLDVDVRILFYREKK
jgi:transcriptional regulator with XRE-family HTH domain